MPLPTFALVGAMKAGTTSLATWLASHPDVFIPAEKETRFFNDPQRWALGLEWYEAQFAAAGDARALGDATPIMSNSTAVDRLADLLPGVDVIVSLRDPADRAWSHYQHLRATGDERRTFSAALAAERRDPEGVRGNPPRDYLRRSRYLPQVQQLLDHFGRERVHVVLFEDLVGAPLATTSMLIAALGLDPDRLDPGAVGAVHDPRPSWRSPRLAAATRRVQHRLPPRAVTAVERLNDGPPRPYPEMPPDQRAALIDEWRKEIDALATLIGRDLSAWTSLADRAR